MTILNFFTANKNDIISCAVVFSELLIITINMIRKIRHENKKIKASFVKIHKEAFIEKFFWSVLPWNLFRKP